MGWLNDDMAGGGGQLAAPLPFTPKEEPPRSLRSPMPASEVVSAWSLASGRRHCGRHAARWWWLNFMLGFFPL